MAQHLWELQSRLLDILGQEHLDRQHLCVQGAGPKLIAEHNAHPIALRSFDSWPAVLKAGISDLQKLWLRESSCRCGCLPVTGLHSWTSVRKESSANVWVGSQ